MRATKISASGIAIVSMLHGYCRQRHTVIFLSQQRLSYLLLFLTAFKYHREGVQSFTGTRVFLVLYFSIFGFCALL